jgi:hypothetical protein
MVTLLEYRDVVISPPAFIVLDTSKLYAGAAVPTPTFPFDRTVNMFDVVAIVSNAFAAGVPVAMLKLPDELINNLVLEFTWKFTKSPLNPVEGLAPKKVPEALPPIMKLEPSSVRVLVELRADRP